MQVNTSHKPYSSAWAIYIAFPALAHSVFQLGECHKQMHQYTRKKSKCHPLGWLIRVMAPLSFFLFMFLLFVRFMLFSLPFLLLPFFLPKLPPIILRCIIVFRAFSFSLCARLFFQDRSLPWSCWWKCSAWLRCPGARCPVWYKMKQMQVNKLNNERQRYQTVLSNILCMNYR